MFKLLKKICKEIIRCLYYWILGIVALFLFPIISLGIVVWSIYDSIKEEHDYG